MSTYADALVQYSRSGRPLRYSHEAFANAMHANRDDALPMLVYADYLDDQGQPGAAEIMRNPQTRAFKYGGWRAETYLNDAADARWFAEHVRANGPVPAVRTKPIQWRNEKTGELDHYRMVTLFHPLTDADGHRYHLRTSVTVPIREAERLLAGMPGIHGSDRELTAVRGQMDAAEFNRRNPPRRR